jgi:ABC-type transport system involved in cytochrome c biogenesis permease subunit
MARAKAEQHPATGTTLVAMEGLSVAFLLLMALLNVAKTGNILTEANLLYAASVFYAGAGVLYLGFGVPGTESHIKFASLATWAGLIANTAAVAHRWYEAGHPPFASLYEMLLSFVWTLAALTLIAEKRYGVKVIGTVTMPVAIVGVVLMQLLRGEVRPLIPALQSTWLHVHVTLAMLAYAACALSFPLAMVFLIQDKVKTETFLGATSIFTVGVYAAILSRFERWGGFNVVAWDAENKTEVFISRGVRLFVTIPDLGWLMLLVTAAVAAPVVLYVASQVKKNETLLLLANRAIFISILLQALALLFFILRTRDGHYPSLDAEGLYATTLAASPFILSALVGGIFANLLYLLLLWRREDLERLLPEAENLDRITYKTTCIAFPLLTLMIAAGAFWANRGWALTGIGIPMRRGQRLLGWSTPLSAHAHQGRLAWAARRLLRDSRLCRRDVHLLRSDVPVARTTRLCLRTQRGYIRGPIHSLNLT